MSNLNKVSKNGNIYYELYISCPVCYNNGKMLPQAYWQHHGCGGTLYIGDDAHYDCNKCSENSHVSNWGYGCPEHMRDAEYDFVKVDGATLAGMISMAGQLTAVAGVSWLQKFLANLGE